MPFDLKAYCSRIEYQGELRPSAECLRNLHLAHALHIPFENLDVLLRRPIRLGIDQVFEKLVENRRGGYCFEQNTLFAAVLESIGFAVTRLGARVRIGGAGITSRTHMLLAVEADGEKWLADVGFGGEALLLPLRWKPDEVSVQFNWKNRLVMEGDTFVLQEWRPTGWADLYGFNLEPHHPIDYEVANHYTSTYPTSFFMNKLMAHIPGPVVRTTLVNRRLTERRAEGSTETLLADDDAILVTLADKFGLHFPAGTRFPYVEDVASATS